MGCAAPSPMHWNDLRSCAKEELLRKPGVALSADGQAFEVSFLNARYRVDAVGESISEIEPDPERAAKRSFQILLIGYLLADLPAKSTGTLITEKDLPGGPTFFRGPHELPVSGLVELYGDDPDGFEARGRRLGAEPVELGDRGMRFAPFPETPVTVVLWRVDEEFPASVSIVFDGAMSGWFSLDMVFLLVGELISRILEGQQES